MNQNITQVSNLITVNGPRPFGYD